MSTLEKVQVGHRLLSHVEAANASVTTTPEAPLKSVLSSSGVFFRGVMSEAISEVGEAAKVVSRTIGAKVTDAKAFVAETISAVKASVKGQVTTDSNNVSQSIWDTILAILRSIVGSVGALANGIGQVRDDIIGSIQEVFEDITGGIGDLIGALKAKLQGLIDSVTSVGNVIKNGITGAIADIGNWIRTQVTNAVVAVGSWVGGQIQAASDWLGETIDNAKDWITQAYEDISAWVSAAYNAARENVLAAVAGFKEFVATLGVTIQDKIDLLLAWLSSVVDMLQAQFAQLLASVGQFIGSEILPRLGNITAGAHALSGLFSNVWSMLSNGDYEGAFSLLDDFANGLGIPAPVQTLQAILSAVAYFQMTIQLQFVPAQVAAQKTANINLALDPVQIEAVAQAVFKGQASEADFYANARLAGVTPERAKFVMEASKALPTPGTIQEGFLRGEIDEENHDRLLRSYGYTNDDLRLFKALYWIVPPPNDLIRMSVREVFSPEIAERYGQFEDFPQAFVEWAAKIGLTEEWAKNYWAAHWDLPSPQMGFEMLHRGVIDKEELTLLLRSLDVMPYWRERLIKISYNPLTRVDVRRMYQLGVLTAEQVFAAYLELGYDREKANWLTEFTKRYSAPEDDSELTQFKSLARNTYSQAYLKKIISEGEYREFLNNLHYYPDDADLLIQLDNFKMLQNDKLFDILDYRKDFLKLSLQAYDRGLLNVHEVTPLLSDLGYSDGEIALELNLADYNRELTIRNLLVGQVHAQYVEYIINNVGMYEILNMFNFAPEEISRLQETWDIERNFRTKRPPLSDLRRFLSQGLIDLNQFLDELRGQGYHEKYIGLFEQSLKLPKG